MRYVATIGERRVTIELEANGRERQMTIDDQPLHADWQQIAGPPPGTPGDNLAWRYSLIIDNRSYEVFVRYIERENGVMRYEVLIDGIPYDVALEDERERALAGLTASGRESGEMAVKAPMPGLVINLPLGVGAHVERGSTVVVLEAMKMENDLPAPRSGTIKELRVTPGQAVNQGQVLVTIGD